MLSAKIASSNQTQENTVIVQPWLHNLSSQDNWTNNKHLYYLIILRQKTTFIIRDMLIERFTLNNFSF